MKRLFANRTYASGTGIQWCLYRWSDAQEPYLTRLFLVKTPWFAVCLNWINQEDVGDPHDHTSWFLSMILAGWYTERRKTPTRPRYRIIKRQFYNYVRASQLDAHRIIDVAPGGALTLIVMGPKEREWGYHTPAGWVHYSKIKVS